MRNRWGITDCSLLAVGAGMVIGSGLAFAVLVPLSYSSGF